MPVTKQDLILKYTHVKMPPNLSMSTGFRLFRKSNLVTAHEHVANSYIDTFMYIHLPLLGTVHRRNRHIQTKRKSLIVIRIHEALQRKLNNLKPLFSRNEEYCISKEFKGNALALKDKSCRPDCNNKRRKCVS